MAGSDIEEGGSSVPIIMSHSGFLTRSESGCGSRSDSHFVSSASLISSAVRCLTKTGLPRHLMITWFEKSGYQRFLQRKNGGRAAYVFALRYGSQVELDLGLREHIRGGGHVDQEIYIQAPL